MGFRQSARDALGYSPGNTATLVCRDVKYLKTRAVAKVKYMFGRKAALPSKSTVKQVSEEADTLQNVSMNTTIVDREVVERVHEIIPEAIMEPVVDNNTTLEAENEEVTETICSTLRDNLKLLKDSRVEVASSKAHWHFLGCWLLLNMAVEYCQSNPLYETLGCGKTATADAAVRSNIFQSAIKATSNVSHRCDEVLDTVSFLPEHWWKTIWEATTDHNRAEFVAEALVRHIWPENNADEVLKLIGSPYEKFLEFEATELRRRLQVLLFPDFDTFLRIQH